MSAPRRWKSTPARRYSPSWMPTPTPRTKRPPERSWRRSGLLGHCGGAAQGELEDAGAEGSRAGRPGGHGQRGQRLPHGVGPVQMVHRPERIGPGRLGPPPELGDLGRRAGRTSGITVGTDEFSLRGGGEDQPELRSGRSTSYRGHTDIVGRRRACRLFELCLPAGTEPRPPRGGASMTDSVQRASQMALPSSSVREMPQTCTVRPTRIGVAVAVRCPSRQGAQVAGVELDADDALAPRRRGQRPGWRPTRPGARRPPVEDAVGLMHPAGRPAGLRTTRSGVADISTPSRPWMPRPARSPSRSAAAPSVIGGGAYGRPPRPAGR